MAGKSGIVSDGQLSIAFDTAFERPAPRAEPCAKHRVMKA